MFQIIPLSRDSFGVYCAGRKDPATGTRLLFRGSLDECLKYRAYAIIR